jgi:hypothetical protein
LIAQGETAAYVRDQMGHSPSIGMGISSQAPARNASACYEKSMADAKGSPQSGCRCWQSVSN